MSANSMDAELQSMMSALPRKKMSGKKLILLIVLPILMLAGGGAGLFVTGAADKLLAEVATPRRPVDRTTPGFFYNLPEMTVNLNTSDRRQAYLLIQPTLELNSQEDVAKVERVLPRIMDNFQIYLRELRLDDLRGSAGPYRLREELLRRVNAAVQPVQVREVLFGRFVVSN